MVIGKVGSKDYRVDVIRRHFDQMNRTPVVNESKKGPTSRSLKVDEFCDFFCQEECCVLANIISV